MKKKSNIFGERHFSYTLLSFFISLLNVVFWLDFSCISVVKLKFQFLKLSFSSNIYILFYSIFISITHFFISVLLSERVVE